MQSRYNPLAVALTALALAAPAAQAKPVSESQWRAVAVSETEAQALASHGKSGPVQHAPRAETADAGLDLASVAMGAGGGVAITVLASLGVAGVSGRGRIRTAR
jgi:hypothetical protein